MSVARSFSRWPAIAAILLLAGAACVAGTPTSGPPEAATATPDQGAINRAPTATAAAVASPTPGGDVINDAPTTRATPGEGAINRAPTVDAARLAELDSYALNAPVSAEGSIKALAAYLAAPARNDLEKTRLIFRWITGNVSYDAKAFFSKNLGDQSAEATLRRRTAVCGGYSALFQALGRAAGLQVETVEGWAKGFGYDVSELDGDPNHAWNAIKLDGSWYLVDATWGAGSLTKAGEFEAGFKPYFWRTPPDQFIVNHLPVESRWQLLPAPIGKAEYATAPLLRPPFFEYGLGLPAGTEAVTSVASEAALSVSTPPDVFLTAAVEQEGTRLDDMWASARRDGSGYEISAVFPGPGKYDLVVFAKRGHETTLYDGAVTLTYEVGQGQPSFAGFPKLTDGFFDYGLELPAGTGAVTKVASRATLLVSAPADILVTAGIEQDGRRLDDMWTFAQRKGPQYELDAVFPGPGAYDLIIFARGQDEAGSYHGVATLRYEVTEGMPQFGGFPKAFTQFTESGAYLYGPKEGGLAAGSTQVFKLSVPGAQQAAVIIGDAWTRLPGQGGLFEGPVAISGSPAQVCALFEGDGSTYQCLLEYR